MILTIIEAEYCSSMTLPDFAEGRHAICRPSDGEQLLMAVGTPEGWSIVESGARLLEAAPARLRNRTLIKAMCQKDHAPVLIYAEEKTEDRQKFAYLLIPPQTSLIVGSASKYDIVYDEPMVEPKHMILQYNSKEWSAKLEEADTHTYVNGRRFRGGRLNMGDMLFLMGMRFIFLPGILCCNCPDGRVKVNNRRLAPVDVPQIHKEEYYRAAPALPRFNRMPRFVTTIDEEKLNVDAPPAQQKAQQQSGWLQMGPALTSGLFAMLGGMTSVMSLGMMASNLIFPTITRKKMMELQEANEDRRQEAYRVYLNDLESQVSDLMQRQQAQLHKMLPHATSTVQQILKDKRHLWDRQRSQDDCMQLRLGVGDWPLKCEITLPPQHFDMSDDPMRDILNEMRNKKRILHNAPIALSIKNYHQMGIVGVDEDVQQLAWQILTQLTMQLGYDELKLCVVGKLPRVLRPFTRLPHTWSDDGKNHFLAQSEEEVNDLVLVLENMLAYRRKDMPEEELNKLPSIVVLFTDTQFSQMGKLHRMLMENAHPGVHAIALGRHTSELPRQCELVIGVKGRSGMLRDRFGEHFPFTLDPADHNLTKPLVSLMENTLLDMPEATSRMPDVVPFLQLFNTSEVEELNLLSRYRRSDPARSLAVPIGIDDNGALCYLDMHERANCFHGLIAGTTGSGKSELIMTLILSLACTFSPEEVAFALIDYKGGSTAQVFEDLPHTAGVITNLDRSNTYRALVSIKSELIRRQKLFDETQKQVSTLVNNIIEYQRLYRSGTVKEPLPHLFIIVDEFAELKTQQPEFMSELVSAARLGRSMGIHLILATQKPAGIVDAQIEANAGFRLCLRVQSTQDSQDMLKRPDAAYLSGVGKFYLHTGNASELLKAQSGYTGAPYSAMASEIANCTIEVVDRTGYVLRTRSIENNKRINTQKQLPVVIDYIHQTARRAGLATRPLWQPPLKATALDVLRSKYPRTAAPRELSALIGEADDPNGQRYLPVRLSLNTGRNTLLYGALGSGKAMTISVMLQDLISTHSPDELNVYILDYMNEGLAALKAAPQVGDVLSDSEDEKLLRLLTMLEKEIDVRKEKMSGAMAAGGIPQRLQQAGLCSILVLIHGMTVLKEKMSDNMDRLMQLLTTGPQYGLCFVGTMAASSGLNFQLSQQFSQLAVLQMPHDDDYNMLLGRVGSMRPAEVRGRGLIRLDKELYEFQVAIPQENSVFCQNAAEAWHGEGAKSVAVMPKRIDAALLASHLDPSKPLRIPVALDEEKLTPVYLNLAARAIHQVFGRDNETEAFVLSLAKLAAAQGIETIVLDAFAHLPEIPDVRILKGDEVLPLISELFQWRKDVKAGVASAAAPKQRLILMTNVATTLKQLDGKVETVGEISRSYREMLCALMEKAAPDWLMNFVVCGSDTALQKLKSEEWYQNQISSMDGLWFGSGIRNQFLLDVSSVRLNNTLQFPMGYVVTNGSAQQVRFSAEEVNPL